MIGRVLRGKLHLFDETGLNPVTIRNMKLIIVAFMFGIVCINIISGPAIAGYLKEELRASDFAYGLIMAIGPVASAFQILASYIIERRGNRTRMFIISGLIQRAAWLPFGLVPLFIPLGAVTLRLWIAALFMLISSAMGPFMNVSFFSIISDVVPMRVRGRYFATRSRITTIVGIISGLVVAALLDTLPGGYKYAVVFAIAAVFGVADIIMFFFMELPKPKPAAQRMDILSMVGRVLKDRRYMRVVIFVAVWSFSVNIAGPFFYVYMKTAMRLSYTEIMIAGQIVSGVFSALVVTRWGRAMDYYGNKPVMFLAALLMSMTPYLWLFAGPRMVWMVVMINMMSGCLWCAIELSAQNLFMGQAPEDNRTMYIAVYFITSQLAGVALSNAAGGWLLDNVLALVEPWGWRIGGIPFTRYNCLFVLSGLLRLSAVLFFLPRVMEQEAQGTRALLRDAGLWIKRAVKANIDYLRAARIRRQRRGEYGK